MESFSPPPPPPHNLFAVKFCCEPIARLNAAQPGQEIPTWFNLYTGRMRTEQKIKENFPNLGIFVTVVEQFFMKFAQCPAHVCKKNAGDFTVKKSLVLVKEHSTTGKSKKKISCLFPKVYFLFEEPSLSTMIVVCIHKYSLSTM